MMLRSDSADSLTKPRLSRCSEVRSVSKTSSVIPRMPFMGVRISWLMVARNVLLASLPASAASLACSSSACIFLRASISSTALA